MSMTLAQIEKEVFQLPVEQQQRLASDIWSHQPLTDEELEDIKIVEARIKEIDEGKVQLIDHDTAMEMLRARLEARHNKQ